MNYTISTSKNSISAEEFIKLFQSVGWGKDRIYDIDQINSTLKKNIFYRDY